MCKHNKKLIKCAFCDKPATWMYMPRADRNHFFCDEHVPRGCDCNVLNVEQFGDPDPDSKVIWWSKQDYESCFPDKMDELISFATMEHQPDSFYYEVLDDDGHRFPCCEYDHDPEGYNEDDYKDNITDGDDE